MVGLFRRAVMAVTVVLSVDVGLGAQTDGLAQQTPMNRVVWVMPAQVHVGDILDVGAKGFEANSQEYLSTICPSPQTYHGPQGYQVHVYPGPQPDRRQQENGWKTDAKGQFAGWTVPVLSALVTGLKLPIACALYASSPSNYFATQFTGQFTILPAGGRDPCSRRICVRVRTVPRHVRSGMVERVSLDSWPGAQVTVTVRAGQTLFRTIVRLNYAGHRDLQYPVKLSVPHSAQSLKAMVRVNARLEDRVGDGFGQFTVIR